LNVAISQKINYHTGGEMTALSASQMRDLEGEGFWDGLACGTSASFALALTLSPDPVTKIGLASAWTAAVVACGNTFF
jgi:hypothetical protein